MGRDKAQVLLAGRPLAVHALARLRPQVSALALNSGNPVLGLPADVALVPDHDPVHLGPLAGVLTGLRHAASLGESWVATVPVDAPFFPGDLVAQLTGAISPRHRIAVAASRATLHPVFALWPSALADDLAAFLQTDPKRRVRTFLERHEAITVDFPVAEGARDPFINLNTPEDLADAERALAAQDLQA